MNSQGLYTVTDMYPFHRQARMVRILLLSQVLITDGFRSAQHLDYGFPCLTLPLAFRIWFSRSSDKVGFPHSWMFSPDNILYVSWRWAYGIGSMYSLLVLFLIVVFGRET
jgi:hypothetical protein